MNEKAKAAVEGFLAEVADDTPFGRPPPIPCFHCGETLYYTQQNITHTDALLECLDGCGTAYNVKVASDEKLRAFWAARHPTKK